MIIINGRFLSQRLTGIQRFAYEICRSLRQVETEYVILDNNVVVEEDAKVGGQDVSQITVVGADLTIGKGKTVEGGKVINEDVL